MGSQQSKIDNSDPMVLGHENAVVDNEVVDTDDEFEGRQQHGRSTVPGRRQPPTTPTMTQQQFSSQAPTFTFDGGVDVAVKPDSGSVHSESNNIPGLYDRMYNVEQRTEPVRKKLKREHTPEDGEKAIFEVGVAGGGGIAQHIKDKQKALAKTTVPQVVVDLTAGKSLE